MRKKSNGKKAYLLLDFTLTPIYFILKFMQKLYGLKFWRMRDNRIGHISGNLNFLLREIQSDQRKEKKFRHVVIASKNPANQELVNMLKRVIKIWQIPQPNYFKALLKIIATRSVLSRHQLFEELPAFSDYKKMVGTSSTLQFIEAEEKRGFDLLNKMGVDNWFICFHARDEAYLNEKWSMGDSYHSFRNCRINNFIPAVAHINDCGGFALRMGSKVSTELPLNTKIIDYANLYRLPFNDIYLLGKCKFFLGNTAGLFCVPQLFNIPVAFSNLIPLDTPFLSERDIFIPKKIWSKNKNRFLTFKEMISAPVVKYMKTEDYVKNDLIPVENTADELLDLTREMNQRIDGTWEEELEDLQLQIRFKNLFSEESYCHGFQARIGAKFLRNNKELLL